MGSQLGSRCAPPLYSVAKKKEPRTPQIPRTLPIEPEHPLDNSREAFRACNPAELGVSEHGIRRAESRRVGRVQGFHSKRDPSFFGEIYGFSNRQVHVGEAGSAAVSEAARSVPERVCRSCREG